MMISLSLSSVVEPFRGKFTGFGADLQLTIYLFNVPTRFESSVYLLKIEFLMLD